MKFLRLAKSKSERVELGKKTKSLLDQAERIKSSEIYKPGDDLLIDFEAPVTPIKESKAPSNIATNRSPNSSEKTPTAANVDRIPLEASPGDKQQTEPISDRVPTDAEKILLLKASAWVNSVLYRPFSDAAVDRRFDTVEPETLYLYVLVLYLTADALD